ncbi:MAG: ABC transporter substrate-binding protein [Chthoniobacteraceae bacterium]|nr:ABC transporter substrate-binding protein [Chthoniobacteraceae bacterium]
MKTRIFSVFLLALGLILGSDAPARAESVIRFGHFPNVTHVQALVAHHLSRQGKGWFEERLGPGVRIEWYIYNAGPSAMEAVFANGIDVTYVGPSPAINAFAKSGGAEVRIVSGAANGGAALVVQPGGGIKTGADFRGKRIATPQLGNTQDVACRAWLKAQGLKVTQMGGDAQVIPTPNPDQLSLFLQKSLDAVWTVEPWVSRLERDAGGVVFLEQKDAVTTVLVSSVKFRKEQDALLRKLVAAHKELTGWIVAHPAEAQAMVVEELAAETKSRIAPELIRAAWKRIELTNTVSLPSLETYVKDAQDAGFLRKVPDLQTLVENP